MKVAIVHLSDIHLKSSHDPVIAREKFFIAACRPIFQECNNAIFVVSGDIANSGKKEEYEVALSFFKDIEQRLRDEHKNILVFSWVLVPGNHDCLFVENEIREDVLKSIGRNDKVDEKRRNYLLSPQNAFWDFYEKLIGTGRQMADRISFKQSIKIEGISISFNCYNTAFLSQIHEVVGSLIVPTDSLLSRCGDENPVISVSVFHHSTGWLSPNTENNNKKRFENHLIATSDIILCGHEHEPQARRQSSLSDDISSLCFEGAAFQDGNKSSFAILVIDSGQRTITKHDYDFVLNSTYPEETRYKEQILPTVSFSVTQNGFLVQPSFEKKLLGLPIPVKHPHKADIKLDDIFIYPDLERVTDNYVSRANFEDASILLESKEEGVIVVEGEAQSGKTSLLNMLFLALRDKGYLPIVIHGRDITHTNVFELARRSYRSQYDESKAPFDAFSQSQKEQKILIIDNLLESSLNEDGTKSLYESALKSFQRVIVSVDDKFDYSSLADSVSNKSPITRYRILSLGYVKRNRLIVFP